MLCLIPAIMSAIAVVREKETGSIANFRSTPITRFEFLIGKQLPYVAVAMVNFFFLFLMAIFLFRVPLKGSFLTLLIATIVYVVATTGFGQSDLLLHPNTGRRGFRDRDPLHRAGREFFRIVRAGFVVVRRSEGYRPDIPVGLVSAGHRRRIRQGAGHRRPLANIAAIAAIATSVFIAFRSPCFASRRREMSRIWRAACTKAGRGAKPLTLRRSCGQHLPPGDQGAEKHPR